MKITQKITFKENRIVDIYFNDVNKYGVLSPKEELELILSYKDYGDELAKNKLINHNLRFVISVSKKFQITSSKVLLMDLISVGNQGLIKAIEKFDHTKGFKFITYAVWWIRHYIMEYIEKNANSIRISVTLLNNKRKINNLLEKLFIETHNEYTVNDLFYMGLITEDELESYALYNEINLPSSLDATLNNTEDFTLSESISSKDSNFLEELLSKDHNKFIISNMIKKSNLKPKEIEVLECLFGLNGKEENNLYQIGDKFNMTSERIRQLKHSSISKIKFKFKNVQNIF